MRTKRHRGLESAEQTQTLDLGSLFTSEYTTSGSFTIRGVRATTFGALLEALPIPALMIDEGGSIVFSNRACRKISPEPEKIQGAMLGSLFAESTADKVMETAQEVFSTRKPRLLEDAVGVGRTKIWGKMLFRSVRVGDERSVLVLIEDLTAEKRALTQSRKHREELQKAYDQLERRVEARTLELSRANDQLRREVTERRRVQEELQAGERRFRSLAETAPFGISVVTSDARFEYFNPKFTEIFGYMLQDIPDTDTWFKKAYPDEEERQRLISDWKRHGIYKARVGPLTRQITTIRAKDGSDKTILVTPVALENRKHFFTYQDITARKRAEDLVLAQRDLSVALSAVSGLGEALRLCAHASLRISGMDTVGIFVADQDGGLHLAAGQGLSDDYAGRVADLSSDSPEARLFMEGSPIYSEQLDLVGRMDPGGKGKPLRCAALIPIHHEGRVVAGFSLGSYEVDQVPDQTRNALEIIAAHIGSAIARLQTEQALRESEKRLELALHGANLGLWDWNIEADRAVLSDNALRLLECSREDFERSPLSSRIELVHPDDKQRLLDELKSHLEGPTSLYETEFRVRSKSGKWIWLLCRGQVVERDADGLPLRASGTLLDVTDRKQVEELRVQTGRLRAIAELANGVAHNFNNLLQIVLGNAQLAATHLDLGELADVKTNLNQILESSLFGSQVVKRLQKFAKLLPDDRAHGELFDLSDTVRQAADLSKIWWKTFPEEKGIQIFLEMDLGRNCMIMGREDEIFELIINLVKNSAEALPQGGYINLKTLVSDDKVFLKVGDNGIGIRQDNMGKIFEPFFTTKGYDRNGVGLSSSLGIVTQHSGKIWVESQEGQGTTFTVEFPYGGPPEDRSGEAPMAMPAGLRILVIDDMEQVTRTIEEGLSAAGQTAITAFSGQEGLRIFENAHVDAVVCDLAMPGMSGWEVGKAIKEKSMAQSRPKPLFVMLTGWPGKVEDAQRISESGVDSVVEKPVSVGKLLDAICALVNAESPAAK